MCKCLVIVVAGVCLSAVSAEMEIRWIGAKGQVEVETRKLVEKDGASSFTLTKDEILSKKVSAIELTPSFARAKKGDKGFWVMANGDYGTFRCDEGRVGCDGRQIMSMYSMQTPERTFVAIVKKLKYYFSTQVVAEKGRYRMSCRLENEMVKTPYEDLEIEFRTLTGKDASLGGIARSYREYQLGRGACKPLKERIKTSPILKEAIDGVEVRLRQAWKPVPSPIPDQTPENEPKVTPYITFDRVTDIAREFKAQGVEKAEFCLVGWNIGGHDGRWPQVFPVEPALGGEAKLRACIRAVQDLGYLIVPHGNYLDAYKIADSWDEEWLLKDLDGVTPMSAGDWGGGRGYRICPQRAYERFMSREMPRMKALGFRGLGYFDVVSIVNARYCGDPRHPLNGEQAAKWWGKGAELANKCFGGFSSEGAFDHFVGSLDYCLYASLKDPRKEKSGLVDRIVPMPQLVYNGIFAMNPFSVCVNFTAQDRFSMLKLIEFGGRPAFYFYSKFRSTTNWMGDGDLGCRTDGELKASVAKVKEGWDIYSKLNHLQYEFMDGYEQIAPNVWCTAYENGEKIVVDYNAQTWSLE